MSKAAFGQTTRASFQRALIDLARTKEFEKITVSELATAAGASRRAFYYYYDSIYGLVFDCYTTACFSGADGNREPAAEPRTSGWLLDRVKRHLEFFQENPQLSRVICRDYLSSPYLAKLEEEMGHRIRRHFEYIYGLDEAPDSEQDRLLDEVSRYVFFGNWFFFRRWAEDGMTEPVDVVAKRLVRTAYHVGEQLREGQPR